MSFLGVILNLLIAEVAYARSNLPKTIIQMQQPMIHLYLADSSSVQYGVSSISGWYSSITGVLLGFNFFPTSPSNLGVTF
jgi:hypothetical protein